MATKQIALRLRESAEKQIKSLIYWGFANNRTEAIHIAIDRMYQEERPDKRRPKGQE